VWWCKDWALVAGRHSAAYSSCMAGHNRDDARNNTGGVRNKARLASALRQNLQRRKAQARGRAAEPKEKAAPERGQRVDDVTRKD
jgi:hypothetical protein